MQLPYVAKKCFDKKKLAARNIYILFIVSKFLNASLCAIDLGIAIHGKG